MMDLIERIRASVIGKDTAVETPFGVRRVTYADYTASGRSLSFIESFINDHVLPLYANTHTETSGTGLQTTKFREDAREIIRKSVGANSAEHAVVFAGSGSTGAVDRLVNILGIRLPRALSAEFGLDEAIPMSARPVIFVGPFEHHSNELPWRESVAEVIEIPEDPDGHIDLESLEARLIQYAERPMKIGSFSAASNVTGITSDTAAVSALLHRYGALSFWDFAAAAPYVQIEMGSGNDPGGVYKDAIFLSPHKFIGGPSTPGVLVVRKELMTNDVPAVPGGGTVQYVSPSAHTYLEDREHREEGGTPAIVGSIRAGLVFQLKDQVGAEAIRELEHDYISRAIETWSRSPNIDILGNHQADRLSIVSFVVRHGDKTLHHNFVVALANDLFGIQARGGCSCAGPYGHRLLGITDETSLEFEKVIARGCEIIKPGWVRVNFNYFIDEAEFQYILEAIDLIASHGWKLLPHYRYDSTNALWRHRDGLPKPPESLIGVDLFDPGSAPATAPIDDLDGYLAYAKELFAMKPEIIDEMETLDQEAETLRWFPNPAEVGI